jgi:hypothetical protein
MAQRQHQSHTNAGNDIWLSMLVDTFESTERLGDIPCDQAAKSAMRQRLAMPAENHDLVHQTALSGDGAVSLEDATQLDHQH